MAILVVKILSMCYVAFTLWANGCHRHRFQAGHALSILYDDVASSPGRMVVISLSSSRYLPTLPKYELLVSAGPHRVEVRLVSEGSRLSVGQAILAVGPGQSLNISRIDQAIELYGSYPGGAPARLGYVGSVAYYELLGRQVANVGVLPRNIISLEHADQRRSRCG